MLTPFLVVLLVLMVVLSRTVYPILVPHAIDRDAYAHMLYASHIRENGNRLPEYSDDSVLSGRYSYPFFMHWILSFLPASTYEWLDKYFSPALDVLLALLLIALYPLGFLDPGGVLYALAVFVVTPEFVRPDLPNAVGMSGRKVGLVLTTAALLLVVSTPQTDSRVTALGAVVIGAFVFLTSKFSIQAFTFVCVGFGLFASPAIAVIPLLSLATAIAVTRGVYTRIFVGYLKFLYEYATVKQAKIFSGPTLNPIKVVREIDTLEDLLRTGFNNRLVRPVANNQFFVATVFTYAFALSTGQTVPVGSELEIWLAASGAAFVLTSLPKLMFLGKAERYLEYAFVPAVIVLAESWASFDTTYRVVVTAILASGALMIGLYYLAYEPLFFSRDGESEADELVEHLQSAPTGVVLVQPFWEGRRIAWETEHAVVDTIMNEGGTPDDEMDRLCPDQYAFVTDDVRWLSRSYSPDLVVFDKWKTDRITEAELQQPEKSPQFENARFAVYDFEDLTEG